MPITRRAMMTGNTNSCHIASMIVQCLPEKLSTTAAHIEAIPNLTVPERDDRGKLIVLIEAHGESQLMDRISKIEATSGVISANLVYHQIDD
jgi:nitrate reductase NapD